MTNKKRPLKVFLCHASQDKLKARELYRYLMRRKVDAWLDEMNLLPGQDWDLEIYKATRDADAIIICLSKESIAKEGYVQKEVRRALDISEEKPDGTIFVIPLRLENCDVPIRLKKYHWVDLFDESGYSKLVKSLQVRAFQLERATVQISKQDESSSYLAEKPNQESHEGVSVHINGNVQGNIIIGNDNAIQSQAISENSVGAQSTKLLIEAPFPIRGPMVNRFTVINKGDQKITDCHARLVVTEIHRNQSGVMFIPHPSSYLYPKNILWATFSRNGHIDLRPNEPNYLDVLELGQQHFRFLFDGDQPLPKGTVEPKNLNKEQTEWLSHRHHLIEITLFGDNISGNPVEIKSEFIINFMVVGNQNIKFATGDTPMGIPYIDENIPEIGCLMSVKKVTSHNDLNEYLE
jgi:hypothetical protein